MKSFRFFDNNQDLEQFVKSRVMEVIYIDFIENKLIFDDIRREENF